MTAMLDWPHSLVLRAVDADPTSDHESPALEDLIACQMVERSDGRLMLTPIGRTVLERSVPSKTDALNRNLLVGAVLVLAVLSVLGWIT